MLLVEPLVEPLDEPAAEPPAGFAVEVAADFLHFATWAVCALESFFALVSTLAAFDPMSLSRHVFTGGSTGTADATPTHEIAAKNPVTIAVTTIVLKR